MGILAAFIGTPIPFVDNFGLFTTFLWLLLFFGGFIMPSLTGTNIYTYSHYKLGTMISSVPKYSRPYASSLGAIIMNLVGYLPAPFLYGLVDEITNEHNQGSSKSRYGMVVLMFWCYLGAALMFLSMLAQNNYLCFKSSE